MTDAEAGTQLIRSASFSRMSETGDSAAESAADESENPFAYLSLEGERFNERGMPATSSREVGFYRQAIYELARQIYLDRNPDRKHVPDGFDAAFDLRLTSVLPGSARPQLILAKPKNIDPTVWDDWQGIFAEARDGLATSARRAKQADPSQRLQGVSKRAQEAIARIGSTLDENEVVVVGHPTVPQRRVRIDAETRSVLKLAKTVTYAPVAPVAVSLTGVITEYDGVGQSFQLQTDAGIATCVLEIFNEELARFARDVLALDGVTAPDVSVEGETLDPDRRPVRLYNVHTISIVRGVGEKALAQRVARLSELKDGWWGPESLAPAPDVLSKLQLLVADLAGLSVPVDVLPSADGSVVIEVRRGATELSAVVEPIAAMTLIRDNVETDELWEQEVPFDVGVLIEFLRRGVAEQ